MQHIFDSHAHYFDRRFEEVTGGAPAILRDVMPEPVEYVLNVGTNCQTSRMALAQAAQWEGMYAAVGIHPEDCHFLPDADAALDELSDLLGDRETRRQRKLAAIGEIGLDYHWQSYDNGTIPMDRDKQAYFFRAQLELAKRLSLPVIVHDREAHGDSLRIISEYPEVIGVFHSFSGSAEMVRDLVKRGWYISFSGSLTFKNAEKVRQAALAVPRERLLVETDAPYLSPHPMRGKLNHSGLLTYTLETLATLWQCSSEEAAVVTSKNAKTLFQIT